MHQLNAKPPRITWTGPTFGTVSYAKVAREIVLALLRRGVSVTLNSTDVHKIEIARNIASKAVRPLVAALGRANSGGILITHSPPEHAEANAAFALNFLLTTYESESNILPFIERLSAFDAIWVQSKYNREQFVDMGIPAEKLAIIPCGVDHEVFSPRIGGRRENQLPFRFGSVSAMQYRKGWDILMRAFSEEFSCAEPVELVIKSRINSQVERDTFDGLKAFVGPGTKFIMDAYSDAQLSEFYRSCDGFVLASRCEGFGMCYLEAMACGVATIGHPVTGQKDFLDAGNAQLIESSRLIKHRYRHFEAEFHAFYYEPDCASIRTQLRKLYDERRSEATAARRKRASMMTFGMYQWNDIAARIIAEIEGRAPGLILQRPANSTGDWRSGSMIA